jgi:hypothetical protein
MSAIDECPDELRGAIMEFWPEDQWDNAAAVSHLESGWSAFATADTRRPGAGCGQVIGERDGVRISAEYSLGWFQINGCNLPGDWTPEHLFNTRHNCGTAHAMWSERGWSPWYFSATKLGLI